MYEITGNTAILRKQYYCMRRWVDYVIGRAASKKPKDSKLPAEIENYLWDTDYHYGEWLIPSQSKNGLDSKEIGKTIKLSSCYTAPIFGWYSVSTFAKIAQILRDNSTDNALFATDFDKYQAIADKMKFAIQHGVIDSQGNMPSNLMGAYVLPIYFDLVPDEFKDKFAETLVKSIEDNNYCMDTGFLATPYLLFALNKIGRQDLAYRLLWQTQAPSWLSEVEHGATTIWESTFGYNSEGNPNNISFNHYAFGAVADWIFQNEAGIVPLEPGYRKIRIAPQFDGVLTSCKRTFESAQGTICVEWKLDKGHVSLEVEIPCNTEADIVLPNMETQHVGSGVYQYESSL